MNLSVRQFQNPTLIDDISRVLERTRVQASSLQLEITEKSMVMENERRGIQILRDLRTLGVRASLDDFGKGYSSLNCLKDLPIDSLKIDKSFVDGLGKNPVDTAIIRLIINLAHTLNLQVTAEGVQSALQLAQLLEMGCDLGQGYYLSEPLTADKIGALMADELSR
jgi:EAL domain-containing protein (putative c-di-GMP-specific phosphodiesterase class I)